MPRGEGSVSYIRAKFRRVTKIRNLAHDHDVIYIMAKFRKVTKIRNLARDHDVICKG